MRGVDNILNEMRTEAHEAVETKQRYRFAKDDDGHTYMIPAEKEYEFDRWLEASPYWENYTGEDFNQYRINAPMKYYSFENPRLDG